MTQPAERVVVRLPRGGYSPIARVLVDGPDFQGLSARARHVFLTLKVTGDQYGIDVQYPDALAATLRHTTGWATDEIAVALDELQGTDWIRREANVLWIVGQLEFHPLTKSSNAKHRLGVQNHVAGLPRLAIVRQFIERYSAFFVGVEEPAADFPADSHSIAIPMAFDSHAKQEVKGKGRSKSNSEAPVGAAGRREKAEYSSDFLTAWQLYPRRGGGNPKPAAFKNWNARIAEGVAAGTMVDAVRRYAVFCEATGKVGTENVRQAATFFGVEKPGYEETWELPKAPVSMEEGRVLALVETHQEDLARDEQWLESRRRAIS